MQRGGRILSIGSLGYSQGKNVRGDCFVYPHNGRRARTLRGWPPPRDEALLEVELLGQQCPKTGDAVPRFEAMIKLPGQSQAERKLIKVAKYSMPKNWTVDDACSEGINPSDNPSRTDYTLPQQDAGSHTNPYGKGAEGSEGSEGSNSAEASESSLEGFLADVLAETSAPIFSDDFPLKNFQQRVQLAKLVIAKNLGKEKTIFLLWGITSGGRNYQRYADARNMLERLIKGENES